MKKLMAFLKDEEGSNAAEYALILAFVAIIVAAFGTALGDAVVTKLTQAADAINTAPGA
jgi:Flp pilus assembly pilin Flp